MVNIIPHCCVSRCNMWYILSSVFNTAYVLWEKSYYDHRLFIPSFNWDNILKFRIMGQQFFWLACTPFQMTKFWFLPHRRHDSAIYKWQRLQERIMQKTIGFNNRSRIFNFIGNVPPLSCTTTTSSCTTTALSCTTKLSSALQADVKGALH